MLFKNILFPAVLVAMVSMMQSSAMKLTLKKRDPVCGDKDAAPSICNTNLATACVEALSREFFDDKDSRLGFGGGVLSASADGCTCSCNCPDSPGEDCYFDSIDAYENFMGPIVDDCTSIGASGKSTTTTTEGTPGATCRID